MTMYTEEFRVERGNFADAGNASSKIKRTLKRMGVNPAIIREVAIASYELELNLVIHSLGGVLSLAIDGAELHIISSDIGPGIADLELVMQEGYSTAPESIRAMGFGAGMGLPNIKRHSHEFSIESTIGKGTTIIAKYHLV